jgi:hypothetical protein
MSKTMNPPQAKRSHHSSHYVLVGSSTRKLPTGFVACRNADIRACVQDAPRRTLFISHRRSSTDQLLTAGLQRQPGNRIRELLTLEPPRPESVPSLSGIFERVVGASRGYSWLPLEELMTVVTNKDAADRFIAGAADSLSQTVALVRGNRMTVVVPFSFFHESGNGMRPDFQRLSITDYGLTVAFGDYEASADGILYEFDPAYRHKLNKHRQEHEQTFGASLRRLRLQRRMTRNDFAPLTAKTIARIERGEVSRPHGKTLETIAQTLGVSADQIESF